MTRRKLDQYFTPTFATRLLLQYVPRIGGDILECCAGTNMITAALPGTVVTNDLDPAMPTAFHEDATSVAFWSHMAHRPRPFDWVVSNPPFNVAPPIVEQAYETGRVGIAMLLRLSYLEPCRNRASWLQAHPFSHLIVLPRISFTGDGKTDNVTCAWFVWEKDTRTQTVTIVSKDEACAIGGQERTGTTPDQL